MEERRRVKLTINTKQASGHIQLRALQLMAGYVTDVEQKLLSFTTRTMIVLTTR